MRKQSVMSGKKTMQPELEFVAFVGIDWADQKHVWCLQKAGSTQRECGELEHKPETVEAWVGELCRRFDSGPIAVAVEQVKGALVCMLRKYECLHLFPVPSTMSAAMRKALYPSGAKDDPRDADLLLDVLVQHRDRLRHLQPDNEETRRVQNLVEERRNLVDEKTAQVNRLIGYLKIYFPQMLQWFARLDTKLVCEFLERWPSLEELKKVPPAELRKFFGQRQGRHHELTEDRIQGIVQATPAIQDRGGDRGEAGSGASDRTSVAQFTGGDRESGPQDRRGGVRASGFFHLPVAAGSGRRAGAALVGGLRLTTRSLRQRRRSAETQWDRTGDGDEWEEEMGAFPLGLCQVSAAKFSRMGGTHNCAVGLGPRLLPATARAGQRPPCCGPRLGLQMDSHRVSLLARSRSV